MHPKFIPSILCEKAALPRKFQQQHTKFYKIATWTLNIGENIKIRKDQYSFTFANLIGIHDVAKLTLALVASEVIPASLIAIISRFIRTFVNV